MVSLDYVVLESSFKRLRFRHGKDRLGCRRPLAI